MSKGSDERAWMIITGVSSGVLTLLFVKLFGAIVRTHRKAGDRLNDMRVVRSR